MIPSHTNAAAENTHVNRVPSFTCMNQRMIITPFTPAIVNPTNVSRSRRCSCPCVGMNASPTVMNSSASRPANTTRYVLTEIVASDITASMVPLQGRVHQVQRREQEHPHDIDEVRVQPADPHRRVARRPERAVSPQ